MIDTLPEKVRAKISPADNGCWLWTGTTTWDGYATTRFRGSKRTVYVNRFVFETTKGKVPEGPLRATLSRLSGKEKPL